MEFRLLVEAIDPSNRPSFLLEGKNWALTPPLDLKKDQDLPRFACISYLWGPDREPHALVDDLTMSTHTRPSLAAAMRSASCNAFWTDVFCVPRAGPERQATLENMGYIYSRASEVIIVLGEDTFAAIQELRNHDFLSESALRILECDEWVSSVWTYQELVNGGPTRFVSERQSETTVSIEAADFLDALGYGLTKWQKSSGLDSFATRRAYPHLDALEDVLADWQTADYASRSALSIFSSMSSKRNVEPANFFYAILGALTPSPQQLIWNPDQNLAEKVMGICESKNDFSFIYTIAPRDTDPQRRWRPKATPLSASHTSMPEFLRPIFVFHCWGEAQLGHYDTDGLWLHGITIMEPASKVGEAGKEDVSKWIRRPELQHVQDALLGNALFATLSSLGFSGGATPIFVAEGFVFAKESLRSEDIVRALVSNQIRWRRGAPGLVHICNEGGKQYVPCAFFGSIERLLEDGESVLL